MKDDREVRCYALLLQAERDLPRCRRYRRRCVASGWRSAMATTAAPWPHPACWARASGAHRLSPADAWRKARQSVEANRPRAAAAALEIVKPEAVPLLNELNASPTRFLASKVFAASRTRRGWWAWR